VRARLGPSTGSGAMRRRTADEAARKRGAEGGGPREKKKRKRKVRLPKGFDPANPGPPPDPERWLPKWQRSDYKKKKSRRAPPGSKARPLSRRVTHADDHTGARVHAMCLCLLVAASDPFPVLLCMSMAGDESGRRPCVGPNNIIRRVGRLLFFILRIHCTHMIECRHFWRQTGCSFPAQCIVVLIRQTEEH